jgi:hypothetical protein
MPDEAFDSVEAIRKHFGKLIKDAEEGDQPALKLQQAEAIAEFSDARAAAADRKAWVREAIDKFPGAKDFPELVTGTTAEEIEASAEKVQERVQKLAATNTADDEGARKLYGDPIAPGTGTPPGPRKSDDEVFIADFQKRWNGNNANGGEGVTKEEVNRYAKLLAGTHVAVHLAENSRIPAVRAALSSIKPK